jgi:hypothetical protein
VQLSGPPRFQRKGLMMPFFYCFYKYRTFHIKTEISGMGCFLFWTEEFRILDPGLKD